MRLRAHRANENRSPCRDTDGKSRTADGALGGIDRRRQAHDAHDLGRARVATHDLARAVGEQHVQRAAVDRGAAAAGLVTATVTIKAIDKTKPSITLQKADGSTFTVAVRHPEKLQQVKVGDLIELTYSTAVALSVEPANK